MIDLIPDFEQAKSKHLLFKSRLRSILFDIVVDEEQVLSHHECSLGKWIYNHALKAYSAIPEMQELEMVHAEIHISAGKLVGLHKSGKTHAAKQGLSEMEAIADRLSTLLDVIEHKISSNSEQGSEIKLGEINYSEYHELLRHNAALDQQIKQQITDSNDSKSKYEAILSALHEGIVIQNTDGKVQSANQSAQSLLGITLDQMLKLDFMDPIWLAIHEDGSSMSSEEQAPMIALKTGIPFVNQLMGIKRHDGSVAWLRISAQPLFAAGNKELTGVVSSFFDITSSRKAKAALEDSERKFRSMMEGLPQIAFTMTDISEADFFNQQWYNYTGLTEEESKKNGWQCVIHPDDLHVSLSRLSKMKLHCKFEDFEMRFVNANGEYRWFLTRLQPIEGKNNEVKYWIGTSTDINDLKQLQQQKDDFITIASHELRTPITSLKGAVQLLNRMKTDPLNKLLPKLIEQANKSTDKVTILINDLLSVSKFNHGHIHLNKTVFMMSEVIKNSYDNLKVSEDHTLDVHGDLSLKIYADPDRIDQVITNFFSNAIKYAPLSKVIKVKIERFDEMLKVSVGDEGPGIPSQKLPHLFDRYYRVDPTGMQNSGLGLGLYICSEIIKTHNGKIGAESDMAAGSIFWFKLPYDESLGSNSLN
jgi:PAS domain S-box-containing protein